MADKQYHVSEDVPALLVPKAIAELDDGTGNIRYEHQNVTYYATETVPREEISPEILAALDEADENNRIYAVLKDKLVEGAGNSVLETRLGTPFAGYDDLDEDQIIELFRVLPGETVAVAKEYEARNKGRAKVLSYNSGTREGATDRLEGNLSADRDDPEVKPVSERVTREVDGNKVVLGDPGLGAGDHPPVNVSNEDSAPSSDSEDSTPSRRSSRRTTSSDSDESSN